MKSWYDGLHAILKKPKYDGFQVLISLGNEVDLSLQGDGPWDDYIHFMSEMRAHIRMRAKSEYVVAVGASTTFYGTYQPWWKNGQYCMDDCPGAYTAEFDQIVRLNTVTDAAIFTYYPVLFSGDVGAALRPTIVYNDFAKMEEVSETITRARNGRVPFPIYVQEVGYPSAGLLHKNPDPRLTGNLFSQLTDPEYAQKLFALCLGDAFKRHSAAIRAVSWWPLFDFGRDENSTECRNFTRQWGSASNSRAFRAVFCTSGLLRYNGEDKPAVEWFTTWSPYAASW